MAVGMSEQYYVPDTVDDIRVIHTVTIFKFYHIQDWKVCCMICILLYIVK